MSYRNRVYIRYPAAVPVQLTSPEGISCEGETANVSVQGFRILSETHFPKDLHLTVSITLPQSPAAFELPVRVVRSEKFNHRRWKAALGVEIIKNSRAWIQNAGSWIENRIDARAERKLTALMLFTAGAGILAKATGAFFCQSSLEAALPVFPLSHPYLTILLGCYILFCGWTIVIPRPREKIFSGNGALIAAAFFAVRLLIKVPLLLHPLSGWVIYGMDAAIALILGWGAFQMRRIETTYRHFHLMRKRELIYPADAAEEIEAEEF